MNFNLSTMSFNNSNVGVQSKKDIHRNFHSQSRDFMCGRNLPTFSPTVRLLKKLQSSPHLLFDEPSCSLFVKITYIIINLIFISMRRNKISEEENSLVECSECHLYYHRQCHKPHVSAKDLIDPQLIWYCSKCTKKMKKEMVCTSSI